MEKYKKLIMNSVVFAIGNLGSKIISVIMVPLYTYFLTTNEYGQVDLVTTAISLFLPLASLAVGQAVIRFAVSRSEKNDRKEIFSNAIAVAAVASLIIILFYPLLRYFHFFDGILIYFTLLLIFQLFGDILSQFTRGIGKVKEFAINGILTTLVIAGLNLYFLIYLHLGIDGYLLSMIIAAVVSNIYLFIVTKGFSYFSLQALNKELLKVMLRYSIPLIPNSIMWWLINGSTRYFILLFVGASANGLFAVANKIPSVLSIATTIFSQAWQLSAFEENDSKDKSIFYTKVFKNYYIILFLFSSLLLIINKQLVTYTVSAGFKDSWKLVPFLLLAAIYKSFSGYLGTTYTAAMETKGVFTTTIYGAIVSVAANFVLLPLFGVYGAGIGTFLAFFFTWLLRLRDTKRLVGIQIDYKELFVLNGVFIIQTIIMHYFDGIILIIAETLCFVFMVFYLRKTIFSIIRLILRNK
ncbi:lipopolysaccharide biosynthesis protein [Tetragenococcus koreensis]|uniref:lipopolysaccharide biosynthesis protein n=1 Tax=Tetragenococcus koreensis TaxID=290335 RepID=UPI001F35C22A|nr:oligosaccharide flippase family protein [Tetragenococcus koreensis]MCF1627483.1 oligosaccharide flippase family protein [Tetragenococcus koreensis]